MSRITITRISVSGRRLLNSSHVVRCSFCSAGRSTRRRRGKLPRAPSKKDRIRSLEAKPERQLRMPSIDLNQVGETVGSRLTQAQQFVFDIWRGEKAGPPRPERTGPVMDRRWWFWNILLMSVPGTLLGLYCEFIAKPEMHEFLGKLNEEESKRIMGAGFEFEGETATISIQEMSNENVMKAQAIVEEPENEENLSLMALKRRLDALESQLKEKDRQLDHLRNYQIERSRQSGIQNRVEDKMIEHWKLQRKPSTKTAEDVTDSDISFSERMKLAVLHGIKENLKTKKKEIENFGRDMVDRARSIVFRGDISPSSPGSSSNDNDDPNEKLVCAVEAAASHTNRASELISSSVSSNDPQDMARAAKEASNAAIEASCAAQAASEAISDRDRENFLARHWKSWFWKARPEPDGDPKPSE